jgi:hypothetical protein
LSIRHLCAKHQHVKRCKSVTFQVQQNVPFDLRAVSQRQKVGECSKIKIPFGRSVGPFPNFEKFRERVQLKKNTKKIEKRKSDARSTSRTRMAVRERETAVEKELEAKGRKSRNPTGGGRFSQVSVRWSAMTAS